MEATARANSADDAVRVGEVRHSVLAKLPVQGNVAS